MRFNKTGNSGVKFFSFLYNHTEGFLMVILTSLLVLDVLLGILARYIHFDVVFATELGKYIFIWLCAIGISTAAKDNQHVRIHFIAKRIPVNPRIIWMFTQGLFLVFSIFFFFYGLKLTWMHFSMNKMAVGFQFPMYIFTSALPVGFALTCIRLIQDIVRNLKDSEKGDIWDTPIQEEISEVSEEILNKKDHNSSRKP